MQSQKIKIGEITKTFSGNWQIYAGKAVEFEWRLFSDWIEALETELTLQ